MRRFLLIANAIVALSFTAFFAYTFFGKAHIDGMARTFVTAKTVKYATPVVELAGAALQSELAQRLLTDEKRDALGAEIAEFRREPGRYVQRLTSAKLLEKPDGIFVNHSGKFHEWKERIRAYYNKVLGRLFIDLRIFSGTNVVAASVAFFWADRSGRKARFPLILGSSLLLLATAFAAFLYIDDLSFFTILSNTYLGWSYPAVIAFLFAWMFFDSGAHLSDAGPPSRGLAR